MKIIVSGKQLKITDAIKNYTEEKISKIFKYTDAITEVDIILTICVKVPLKKLNDTRRSLMEKNLMNMNYKIKTKNEYGFIAINKNIDGYEIVGVQPRAFVFRRDDSVYAHCVGGSQTRAEVVRIGNAVEYQHS